MTTDQNGKINPGTENTGGYKGGKVKNDLEKRIRGEGLKKGIIVTSIIFFLIMLVGGIIVYSKYNRDHNSLVQKMDFQKDSLTERISSRDSVITDWLTTFDEIEKNIALIKEKEKIITDNSNKSEMTKDRRNQVLEDIKYINTLLDQNKKKIASLNAQLAKSGSTIKILETKISELEASMKQNETEIAELKTSLVNKNFEVEQLNVQMVVLNDTIAKKEQKISDQTYEMTKAFYTVGTYKELKAKGLLTKEGGFIGLGKTKTLTGSFPDSAFVQIDITKTNSIQLNSKSAKLISEHPAGSYEIVRGNDKIYKSIEIKDPALFWKNSRYAVVEITN